MYLTTVPQDAKVTILWGSYLDGVDAFFDMAKGAEHVSKERAIEVLEAFAMMATSAIQFLTH